MARILIAPTTNTQAYDEVSRLLRQEGHSLSGSGIEALDWGDVDPKFSSWTPRAATNSLLGNAIVKSAYADLERDMRLADACLVSFPARQDAAMIAGWFAAHQKDVVGLVSGTGELPLLAFMTTDLCLTVSEVVEAFSDR